VALRRIARLALLLGSLLAVAAPAAASDGVGRGAKWPNGPIRVFNAATADAKAVDLAIAAWNSTRSRVRFVKVKRRARAQVVVRYDNRLAFCGLGFGSIGYPGPYAVAEVRIRRGTAADGQSCAFAGQALVVAHELGHVLGFAHDLKRCSIMNRSVSEGRGGTLCVPQATGPQDAYVVNEFIGRWRCGILEPIDLTRMLRRYGGTAPAPRADPWCDLYPPIEPPAPLVLTRADVEDGAGGVRPAVRVDLTRPADPVLPPFIAADATLLAGSLRDRVYLYRTPGACPAERPLDPFTPPPGTTLVTFGGWQVAPGAAQAVLDDGVTPGPQCYAAWTWDHVGRPSRTAAQATIVVA